MAVYVSMWSVVMEVDGMDNTASLMLVLSSFLLSWIYFIVCTLVAVYLFLLSGVQSNGSLFS